MASAQDVDFVLVGAGLTGVFMLAEALQQGLQSVVVLDKKDRWWLPPCCCSCRSLATSDPFLIDFWLSESVVCGLSYPAGRPCRTGRWTSRCR